MFNLGPVPQSGRFVLIGAVACVLVGTQSLTARVQAAEAKAAESSSVTKDNESVSLEAHHHYQSAADRANDALLITEVKSALANDGVTDDSPIIVDCDHGKILLTGVMKSAEDAKRAGNIAASAQGVVAVNNQLTWH